MSARAYVEQVQQWNVRCGRCGVMMGDSYDSAAEAQRAIEEYGDCGRCEDEQDQRDAIAAEVAR